jgi:hypothetical protein
MRDSMDSSISELGTFKVRGTWYVNMSSANHQYIYRID